jgi:hypothetical protein
MLVKRESAEVNRRSLQTEDFIDSLAGQRRQLKLIGVLYRLKTLPTAMLVNVVS